MSEEQHTTNEEALAEFAAAAHDRNPVSGWTHNFYRYPARFSPKFAAAAIDCFSKPGDLVLDPYMGGGTTVVESLAAGRRVVGNDLNSLASFVARAKTTRLSKEEAEAVHLWAERIIPTLSFRTDRNELHLHLDDPRTKNMDHPRAKFIKKVIAGALQSIQHLPSLSSQTFIRCALLRTAQWALDGRRKRTSLTEFRETLASTVHQMLASLDAYWRYVDSSFGRATLPILSQADAGSIDSLSLFSEDGERADLVVTSPPYPGVHVLYHRWQVDGRKETPAPYWIAACQDGQGASFYNFGGRKQEGLMDYFKASLRTLQAIRNVLRRGAYFVQMIAFSDPETLLPRYLENMEMAGFQETFPFGSRTNGADSRIWRQVPGRKWHAAIKGRTHSSREVVLIHRAV